MPSNECGGGATLNQEEGKSEAFLKMPSTDMPSNECEGALHEIRRKAKAKHF